MENELFECDICLEQFDETGAHVPLVLPCGHTLCFQCVGSLQAHVCPTCKHPLSNGDASTAVFPRNNWLIRCLGARQPKSASQPKRVKLHASAPKVGVPQAVQGQRVLFKQLVRACDRSWDCAGRDVSVPRASVSPPTLSSSSVEASHPLQLQQEEKQRERLFLLNLSRICKEKKALDNDFDQKRFVKEGLVMQFGEAKARSIILQVNDRIKLQRGSGGGGVG